MLQDPNLEKVKSSLRGYHHRKYRISLNNGMESVQSPGLSLHHNITVCFHPSLRQSTKRSILTSQDQNLGVSVDQLKVHHRVTSIFSFFHLFSHSLDQDIADAINQPIVPPIHEPFTFSISPSSNPSIHQSINPLTVHYPSQPINQPTHPSAHETLIVSIK